MKVDLVYWEDELCDRLVKRPIEIKPFEFKIAQIAGWRLVIADEDRYVKEANPEIIKIKRISLPENTMVSPLSIMRHGLGTLISLCYIGKPRLVEEEKEFDKAIFLPAYSGEIKKGDILGILKVYFVKTEMLEKEPEIAAKMKEKEIANLVYWKDGEIVREKIVVEDFNYVQSLVFEWVPVVSAEDAEIKKGELKILEIEEIKIPPNTILDSLFIMRNALGDVIDVFSHGKPKKVEEERVFSKVLFVSVRDGKIEKGDLLSVLSLHHIAVDKPVFKALKLKGEAKLVYSDNGNLFREKIEITPYGHKGTPNGRWEILVAEEDKKIKKGEVTLIKIKDVKLQPNTVVSPLFVMRHGLGTSVDVYSVGKPRRIEEGQKISHALFLPIFNGRIKKGEIIGVLKVFSIEVSTGEKIINMLKRISKVFSMDVDRLVESKDWPYLWR